MTTRTAKCCCSSCSIEVSGEPVINAICHCANCKRRTGSAFGWSTYFADSQVIRKGGPLAVYTIDGANAQQRSFCSRCGTTLFWFAERFADHTGVAGGCFSDPLLGEPSATVSNAGRCAWLTLPDSWSLSL